MDALMDFLDAAGRGNIDRVVSLIKGGAVKVDDRSSRTGQGALHSAAVNGEIEMIRVLLGQAARVDLENEHGNTPLFDAVLNGHTKAVEELIKAGANVSHKNREGMSPLALAVIEGDLAIARLLVEAGAR
ncbi:MAG: ankyrin repeat domain-containing protein [Spirochaetales bacterium]|nr:ankyrin repeat domain-containing protein [Leptospiraceae bacterium]MCP5479946.1 ankyrin repeat domain-containing protein [Spirochaetales bacterium]MCP5487000.1 ankyrin repeat domain-containing protein [Spirochaetales bacterium]